MEFFKGNQLISRFSVSMDKKIGRFNYPKCSQLWWGYPYMRTSMRCYKISRGGGGLAEQNKKYQKRHFFGHYYMRYRKYHPNLPQK